MTEQRPVPVPQPRDLRWGTGTLPVGRLDVGEIPAPLAAYRTQIDRLVGVVGDGLADPAFTVVVTEVDGPPESYRLRVDDGGVRVWAADSHGVLHAVRTLVDLWDTTARAHLPHVEVTDAPTFAVRGIFAESFAGSDLMGLADWAELVDRLGQLKLNTLGVSVYGCWQLIHDQRTEYLFLPLRDFPALQTPQRMLTWDPGEERETELTYLPRMFTEDFFCDLLRYAAEQGIEVVPHFGGPGHSSLLPRLLPELSAVDEDGRPSGYGYCVSRPEALDTLRDVVRCLVRQHLRPAGVRRLHVAADEYYPVRGVDPDDPARVVSPYCRCEDCRKLTPGDQLVAYLLHVGRVLAGEGITMVHWQDTLVREGVLDRYLDQVAAEGLPTPAVAWWKYNDPVPTPDTGRAETWVSPTTGLFSTLFHQDFTPNVESVLRRGASAGATGAFAYTLPNPADHANLACLADLAWNLEGSGGATGFWRRWADVLCPDDADRALHAFSQARTVNASYPLMLYVVDHVLPFFATVSAGVTRFPDDLLRAFALPQPPLGDVLRQVRDTLRDASCLMPPGRAVRNWPDPVESWRQQLERVADWMDLFLDVLAAARTSSDGEVVQLVERGKRLMRRVHETTPPYLAPAVVREHWRFVRDIEPASERVRGRLAGAESWYGWIV